MYKQDLALNNLQRLILYKTQPTNQPTNQLINQIQIIYTQLYGFKYSYIILIII